MKNNLPALIFFCVGAVFALFFLVLAFFYIAREKKKRNAFDVSVTVLCSVALVLAVIIGLCAAFYKFPLEKVAVSGEYDAAFSLFGLNFTVPGFGAVLAFIMTPYGIALYSLALFALVFFAVIHPLRVLRKKEEQGVRASELKEPAVSETDSDLPHDADESEMPVKEEDDDFIQTLSEENLSDKIDEIVTQAKIEVSSSDDVSPYMISNNDVSDVLDMINEEDSGAEEESVKDTESVAEEKGGDGNGEDSEPEEETDGETAEDTDVETSSEEEDRPAGNAADESAEEKPQHISDNALPVTVRTIIRRKSEEAETPEPEAQEEPVEQIPPKKKPAATKKSAAQKKPAAQKKKPEPAEPVETREVEAKPHVSLPVNRRYVVQNRRNVVNMFNEYLNSKEKDEKEKLESSLNTIILK